MVVALCALALGAPQLAQATIVTVDVDTDANAVDPGQCELREAIIATNTDTNTDGCSQGAGSADTIQFSNDFVISPATELPPVTGLTGPTTLDARNGAGCTGGRQVTLDGTSTVAADGLELAAGGADGSTVCGFRIGNFDGAGIRIGTDNADVLFNRIGLFEPAAVAEPNGTGILLEAGADGNDIGTDSATQENVISGNGGAGINIDGGDGNRIRGNSIGTTPDGSAALDNTNGIIVGSVSGDGADTNVIGGSGAGQGNLISGNSVVGVNIDPDNEPNNFGNIVQGNRIGTNLAGTGEIPNGQQGIRLIDDTSGNVIGGDQPGEGNLISGNNGAGIINQGTDGNVVQGNFIGTNTLGTAALPNGAGVDLQPEGGDVPEDNEIGAPDTSADATGGGARNLISGNDGSGVRIAGAGSDRNTVEGNFIGTNAAGTAAIPNGTGGSSGTVFLDGGAAQSTIGGSAPGAGNMISGNQGWGVRILSVGAGTSVVGNLIGTDRTGTSAVGNTLNGVQLDDDGVTIGGTAAGTGNTIAFNNDDGVHVTAGTGNAILRNSIFSNGNLAGDIGIDLEFGADGITANDLDANNDSDTGANNLQNFPTLTGAQTNSVDTTIQGALQTSASGTFRVEFFSNPACDNAGNGEGRSFLGATTVTTDATGAAAIAATIGPSTATHLVTATATSNNGTGDTSEFSPCQAIAAKAEPPAPDPGTGGGGTGGGDPGDGDPGGGGGGGGTTADTKAPLLDVGGDEKQTSEKKVKVEVSCDEACTVDATGTIKVPKIKNGKAKGKEKHDLKGADEIDLDAGETAKLKLELKGKTQDLVKKAQKAKETSKAKVTSTATDAAGNSSDELFEVKVKK